MTTVDTTTAVGGTVSSNQRKIARTSSGRLWTAFYNGSGTEFWYSDDDGANWSQNSSATISGATNGSLFIDLDDHAHYAYSNGSATFYRRNGSIGTSTAWSSSVALSSFSGTHSFPDVVAHREGTGWKAHVLHSRLTGTDNNYVYYARINVTSGGTVSADVTQSSIAGSYLEAAHTYPCLDMHHTGDGKTVSSPHLYAAWSAGNTGTGEGVRFKKAAYSSGSWTWGTERELDSTSYAYSGGISSVFDGTRFVVAYADSGSTATIKVRERDAADTTTTARTPTALSDGAVEAVSVSYDGEADVHLWAVGTTSDDVKRVEYDRSAGTWGSWATVAAATATADSLSLKRGYSSAVIEGVYTSGSGSPYSVVYESFSLNQAPTAPTWENTNNQPADVAETLTLDWTFNDPDDGDTQSAHALSRQIGAGALEYYNAGTTSWAGTETKNVSSTSSVTLAASWGSDGDGNHKYKAKTWDASDVEGVYGSELTVTPSAQDNPTLTAPADAGTITTPSVSAVWTVATQTQYRARLLTSGDVQIETSGWVTSSSTSHAFGASLENSTAYKVEVTTKNDEGLTSDTDTHTFDTSFTPPSTPTLSVSETPAGALTVAITNPGAGATEDYNDVFVRVASGGSAVVDRPVGGDGIRIATNVAVDGSHVDYVVASGVDYEYRVRCVAENGSSADSVWT